MAQNHGSRARPWANLPVPAGRWAPFAAIAAVLAAVALVANGPRIGGDAPSVPDGRPYATAGATPAPGADRTDDDGTGDDPRLADHGPAPAPPSSPRPRRRVPAKSHRERRAPVARPRARSPRRSGPAPVRPPAPARRPEPRIARRTAPIVRRPAAPHRSPISSAEHEFGL